MNIENQEALDSQHENQNQANQQQQVSQPENTEVKPEVKNLEITGEINHHLTEAGKWSSFLSILGFIFVGLIVMGGLIMSLVFALMPSSAFGGPGVFPFPMFLVGFVYLIMGAVYFLPILYLFRFSSGIKQALKFRSQEKLSSAFMNLKAHYRFIGILMIVVLVLYAVMFVVMLFAGLFAGMAAGFLGTPA